MDVSDLIIIINDLFLIFFCIAIKQFLRVFLALFLEGHSRFTTALKPLIDQYGGKIVIFLVSSFEL